MTRPAEPPPDTLSRGGVARLRGRRGTTVRVHVGPADGVCSVEPEGCGYCLGVPCAHPIDGAAQ